MRVVLSWLLALTVASGVQVAVAQQIDLPPPNSARASVACGACIASLAVGVQPAPAQPVEDTVRRRKAIQYSEAYGVRFKIHRIASYAEIPLFVGEYFLGEKLLRDRRNSSNRGFGEDDDDGNSGAHGAVAAGLGVLFTVNTITGAWNLFDSRKDPAGRTRRWIHTLAMLAADAGFLLTARAADDAGESRSAGNRHRNLAIGSMSLATASTVMMWLWRD